MERSLPNTEAPGIKSAHAMITDNCRTNPSAFHVATERIWKTYRDVTAAREANDCADLTTYHLVLSVEDLRHKPNQDIAVRTYIGGVRRKTNDLSIREALDVRKAAQHLIDYLTNEYSLADELVSDTSKELSVGRIYRVG